jgi:hypothetical protein
VQHGSGYNEMLLLLEKIDKKFELYLYARWLTSNNEPDGIENATHNIFGT